MDFGAFVELAPGVEGLVHISQVSTKRIGRVSEVLKEGQSVQAKVQNIDLEKKRISLSIADVERDARATAAAAAPAPASETPTAPTSGTTMATKSAEPPKAA